MPNWCYNSLCVGGDEDAKDELYRQLTYDAYQHRNEGIVVLCGYPETVDKDITMREYHNLVKLAGDTDENKQEICLENIYPCMDKEDPYTERVRAWGTGRESFYIGSFPKDTYTFDTAWSPADRAMDKLAEQYPELHIEYMYDEPGMCFCGKKEYYEGKCESEITENDFDNDYTKAYINIFDVGEYCLCEDCGFTDPSSNMDDECYSCGSVNVKLINVGSDDDKLFQK